MHGKAGQQSVEDANDMKRWKNSQLRLKMTNVERIDKEGNIFMEERKKRQ